MTSKGDGDSGSHRLGIRVGEDFVHYAGVTGNLRVKWVETDWGSSYGNLGVGVTGRGGRDSGCQGD